MRVRRELEGTRLRGAVEATVGAIWCEVLQLATVDRDDSFFGLGAGPAESVAAAGRISRELGVAVGETTFRAYPTLSKLSEFIRVRRRALFGQLPKIDRSGPLPLSFAQYRMWFLAQMGGVGAAYNVPLGVRLRGRLDHTAMKRALDGLVARHEALRTTFKVVNGDVFQTIAPPESGLAFTVTDLTKQSDGAARLSNLLLESALAPFDLEQGPCFRGILFRVAAEEHVLQLVMHHVACDGWSLGVLTGELALLYEAFVRGEKDPLEPLAIQYADYAAWQRRWLSGDVLAEQNAYWLDHLRGAPALLELPTDRRRPAEQDFQGGVVELEFGDELTASLKALGRRYGLTLFMTVLAGWALVLSRLSGQDEVVVGAPVANRTRSELENLVGLFVNTVAIRVDLSRSPTVEQLLMRVRAVTLSAQEHQDLPFEQVVELVQPARSLAHTPVFQVMFTWQDNKGTEIKFSGLISEPIRSASPGAKFDLSLDLQEMGGRIVGCLEYASALFDHSTVQRWGGYLHRALEEMCSDVTQATESLRLLSPFERHQLLVERNDTAAPYPNTQCIHELLEAQTARDPAAIAVVMEDRSLSYGELNARANRLAHHLRDLGVGPEVPVAICVERSLDTVVGLVAVLKAGGAYVPMDPAYPVERLAFMIRDSAPAVVLTHGPAWSVLKAAASGMMLCPPVLDMAADAEVWQHRSSNNPAPAAVGLTARNLAYVIYTSGSTGTPKGVMVEHSGAIALSSAYNDTYGLRPGLSHLQMASFSFDVFSGDVIRALGSGGRLVICPRAALLDSTLLLQLVLDCSINVAEFVPVVLGRLIDEAELGGHRLESFKTLVCSSDRWSLADARRITTLCGQQTRIFNTYGVTEATIDSTFFAFLDLSESGFQDIPIGKPFANTRVYILDTHGEPVPPGVIGEIHIGGVGVARGYLNRPELTAERFLSNPSVDSGRLYKTGDLGRYLADGNIELLGRNDFQVKIRGFRIELDEIVSRLATHPQVREAVVVAREDKLGEKRLEAYYVAKGGTLPGAEELREHLLTVLPEHMVPAAYVRLDALPLTPNGKVDRAALPRPEGDTYYATRDYEAPRGPVEAELAIIWADLLDIEQVGRNDNFFELGGHSLMAMRVISRVGQKMGRRAFLMDLFSRPTVARFAETMDGAVDSGIDPIVTADRNVPLELSFAQQRLWFLSQLENASEAYHIPLSLKLSGHLDEQALRGALDQVVARHETLRTTFTDIDGDVFQKIGPLDQGFLLSRHDLTGSADFELQISALIEAEAAAPFNMAIGPLGRGRLIHVASDEHILLITLHHIVADGWSMNILAQELTALYNASVRNQAEPLRALPVQYADYAAWQRRWFTGDMLARQSAYWRNALAGAPALIEIPTDRHRPPRQDYRGATVRFRVEARLCSGLRDLSRRQGTTLFTVVLAAWAVVLYRLCSQEDVVIGLPTAGRTRAEVEGLIGFFVNTLALRINLSGDPTLSNLLDRVKTASSQAQNHQDIPFDQVVEQLQPIRSLSHAPVFQVMFNWQNEGEGKLDLFGLQVGPAPQASQKSKFDLTLSFTEEDDLLVGTLGYASALFDKETIERYAGYVKSVMNAMITDIDRSVKAVSLLSPSEKHRLLVEWNATTASYPGDKCVHELFEAQVARTPHAVALAYEGTSITYGDLNSRANRLAHQLRALGVTPDARVAICAERSIEMVVAVLGVLKAGGAYVPLDPSYPSQRLSYMLEDCTPLAIVTHPPVRTALERAAAGIGCRPTILDISTPSSACDGFESTNLPVDEIGLQPNHLAYVIYTSGSTGQPKGCQNEHRAVVNRLTWMQDAYRLDETDKVLQKTAFGFDVSVWEVFWPLLVGAALELAPLGAQYDPSELVAVIASRQITIIHFVPSMLTDFLNDNNVGNCISLRRVICSGEGLPAKSVRRFLFSLPRATLHNLYGPTEAAIDVTAWTCPATFDDQIVPIGRPISNTRIYLLDDRGEPVPQGAIGEIYIGGAGVGRGYLNRPELTAKQFIPNLFVQGDRLYRTGDVARYLPTGDIEFLGRTDHQVKIRGFRIELGEVEACLSDHTGVREAVVVANKGKSGDKQLVAYFKAEDGFLQNSQALRSHLLARLPEHMVPAAYVSVEAMPLTPSGKLDRKALPLPRVEDFGVETYEVPVGSVEASLAVIWIKILGVDKVGRSDNFFNLGGHSLLAVRLVRNIFDALKVNVPVHVVFDKPIFKDFANTTAALMEGEVKTSVPLARPEDNLWFLR